VLLVAGFELRILSLQKLNLRNQETVHRCQIAVALALALLNALVLRVSHSKQPYEGLLPLLRALLLFRRLYGILVAETFVESKLYGQEEHLGQQGILAWWQLGLFTVSVFAIRFVEIGGAGTGLILSGEHLGSGTSG